MTALPVHGGAAYRHDLVLAPAADCMTMHALASIAVLASFVAAQAGSGSFGTSPPELAAWPQDWSVRAFAPIVDAGGRPIARRVVAGGATDFDADGNADLWFLTESAPGQTQMHALMANTGDLGRFRQWADYAPAALPDAASYHSRDALDMVLAVDPASDRLSHFFFVPNMSAPDPRLGGYWGRTPGWQVGLGCFEIETANTDGDAHDDLLLLRRAGEGLTEVKLVVMGNPSGGQPSPQREVKTLLPFAARNLRALDFDGDGRTDAALELPGSGILVLRGGKYDFQVDTFVPLPAGLRDLCVGDLDRDGRDELGIVVDTGVLVIGSAVATRLLASPAGTPSLASARCVDIDRDGTPDVVASLASGDGVVVHRQQGAGFAAPDLYLPAVPPPAGGGVQGLPLLTFDADRDGDLDLAVQVRDAGWVVLQSAHRSLAPLNVQTVHEGRFGENYISERLDFSLPTAWLTAGIDHVEVGVYMRHPTAPGRPWVLWANTDTAVSAASPLVTSVRMLYLVDLSKLPLLTSPYLYSQGLAVSGDTLVTVHGKVGRQRYQSMLVFHEGRGDENKSTLGVQWKVIAAPPLPRADAQLLPF